MDNLGITYPLKPQRDLYTPKIPPSKTSIIYSPITNGQITSDQQKIKPTTVLPKSSFPPSLPPYLKNLKATDEHSATSKALTALESPRNSPKKSFNLYAQSDISVLSSLEAFTYLVALH